VKHIKVLGTGCANCRNTIALLEAVASEQGIAIELEKVQDPQAIGSYGVMRTPAVVIDGVLKHQGGIPERAKVESWFV